MANERTEGEAAATRPTPGNGERLSAGDPFRAPARIDMARMTGHRGRQISREALRMVVLEYLAKSLGINIVELLTRAEVHFLDADDHDVPLDEVTVTWDER